MADYIAAHITIGGPIHSRIIRKLCQAICEESISLEYGDAPFLPNSASDLLDVCTDENNASVLRLVDDEAAWGEFPTLETFLREHQIAFNRFHEGKYDIDPGLLQFRPDTGVREFAATSSGTIVTPVNDLLELKAQLEQAIALAKEQPQRVSVALQSILDQLSERLVLPQPLQALQVVR